MNEGPVSHIKAPRAEEEIDFSKLEDAFFDAIDVMKRDGPDVAQLTKKWEDEYDKLAKARAGQSELIALFRRFDTFLVRRAEALSSIDMPEGLDPHLQEELREFDRRVAKSFGNMHLFLGNGGTAEVYEMMGHPEICIKFITNQDKYNLGNNLRTEFGFLKELRGLTLGRIKLPAPFFLRIHPRDGHSYGMEKVEGRSLSQLLEKPWESPELIELARHIDEKELLGEMRSFLEAMHERGVTHNDLKLRNVMLDASGAVYIIDFGRAKRRETEEQHGILVENDITSLLGEMRRFFKEIDNIEK